MRPDFGVDGIEGPFQRRDVFNLLIDSILEGNQNSIEIYSDFSDYINVTAKLDEYGKIEIVAEHKRLTYHNPAVTFLFGIFEQSFVGRFIFVGEDGSRHFALLELPPDVVDANENAQDIGIMVETILFPAFVEVSDGVAGDAPVDNVQVIFGVLGQEEICDEMDVAEAEGLVCAAVPVGVGNAVADKENGLIRF